MTTQMNSLTAGYDPGEISPGIVHFGVGNFHRSHQAMYLDRLLRQGIDRDWGIIGVGLLPGDARIGDVLRAQDFSYTLVELAGNGDRHATRIHSIVDFLHGPAQLSEILEHLAAPATRIVTLTITEGGYNTSDSTGVFDTDNPAMIDDAHSDSPRTAFGVIAAGLKLRRERGFAPFTVASCDNIPGNGDVTRQALVAFAQLAYDEEFSAWIDAEVAFPNSMVDRITPVTGVAERALVRDDLGVVDAWPVVCEPFAQWIIEDHFPLGRPRWEKAGAELVDDVEPFELMKLRMLNGSHQAMAYLGLLRGHRYVHEAMADPEVAGLVSEYMTEEAASTLTVPPGGNLADYAEILLSRFSNAHISDTLVRLATDAADRIPKFLVPVARDRSARGLRSPACAAVIAGWAVASLRGFATDTPLPERQGGALADALADAKADPARFLEHTEWFGDLRADTEFVSDFVAAFERYLTEANNA